LRKLLIQLTAWLGPNSSQDDLSLDLTFRPVIPFTAFGRQNILRLTLPFRVSGRGNEGLGAVSIFDLVVLDRSWLTSWAMADPLPRAICIGRMISTGKVSRKGNQAVRIR
jgi:hypothetical protein